MLYFHRIKFLSTLYIVHYNVSDGPCCLHKRAVWEMSCWDTTVKDMKFLVKHCFENLMEYPDTRVLGT